jgi:5'-3' exoribonuclease 1
MPLRSFKLLPPEFAAVPQTMLDQYPTDFGLDLNGKTNAWEAIVLIPFVDESQVLAAEKHLFD